MKAITKRILVAAQPDDVWRAWATEEGAQTFFAPEARIQPWPGGSYEIHFFPENEPGFKGAEGTRVLSFIPGKMISFDWDAPPHFPEVRKERTWVVVEISPAGDTHSSVELTHLGWQEGEQWDQVYDYFTGAWDTVLGRLASRFTHGPIDWKNR